MISLVTGLPGSGKTYYLTQQAQEALERHRKVYINYKLNVGPEQEHLVEYFHSVEDIVEAKDGLIIMDEAHIYFNARKWDSLPPAFQYKLQQHRKHGLDILGAVQNEARIDVIFRELVASWKRCTKIIGSGEGAKKPWGLIIVKEFSPEDMKKDRPRLAWVELSVIRKKTAHFYDTNASIPIPEVKDVKMVKFKVCPHCQNQKRDSS